MKTYSTCLTEWLEQELRACLTVRFAVNLESDRYFPRTWPQTTEPKKYERSLAEHDISRYPKIAARSHVLVFKCAERNL